MFEVTLLTLTALVAATSDASLPRPLPYAIDVAPPPATTGLAKGSASFVGQQGGVFIVEMQNFAPANLLDLEGTTLTFTPAAGGFTVASGSLQFDSNTGAAVDATEAGGYPSTQMALGFDFPFAGQSFDSVFINAYGSLSFDGDQNTFHSQVGDRFELVSNFGPRFEGMNIIAPLFRQLGGEFDFVLDPNNVNQISFRSGAGFALITWEISEPYSDLQNFTQDPRVNRFQVRLNDDGSILFSYDTLMVEDGVVGVFSPMQNCSAPQLLSTIIDEPTGMVPPHIDIQSVSVFDIGPCGFEVRVDLAGAPPMEGDPQLEMLEYTVRIDTTEPFITTSDFTETQVALGVAVGPALDFIPKGAATFDISGDLVTIRFSPSVLMGADRVAFFVDALDFNDPTFPPGFTFPFDQSLVFTEDVPAGGGPSTLTDLSARNGTEPATGNAYESFHYVITPPNTEIACALINAVGDQFDMLVNFTDFRTDTQEAGARSSGSIGTRVSGLSSPQINAESATYCSSGQLQVVQDYVAISPPIGQATGSHFGTPWTDFGAQVALMSHELGHRWMAYGDTQTARNAMSITDGVHWVFGLHLESPGEVTGPFDHSPMGGNFWVDNMNGTFTQATSGFFFPPRAYGWLDLYLMGLASPAEVPDFFVLENAPAGTGPATQHDVTVDDFIAINGTRVPTSATAQTEFTLGVIGIVLPGENPSAMLIENGTAIGAAFERYFSLATEGRATVDACPGSSRALFLSGFEEGTAFCAELAAD